MRYLFIINCLVLSPLYAGDIGSWQPNLQYLLHFNEGKGTTAYDSSPNKSSATLEGPGTTWESGNGQTFGYRMNFDGITGKVTISSGIAFGATGLNGSQYTFCARVKLETFQTSHKILFLQFNNSGALRRYFTIFHDGAGNLRQFLHATTNNACGSPVENRSVNNLFTLNEVTDVCYAFDGNNIRVYAREPFSQNASRRNWTVVLNAAQTGYCNSNNGQAFLGWYTSSNMLWDGWMEEVAWFDVGLTTAQVKAMWGDRLNSRQGFSQ